MKVLGSLIKKFFPPKLKTFKVILGLVIKTLLCLVWNELLTDIEQKNENGDNELIIFMQIYIKLAKLISYDNDALSEINDDSAEIIKDPYVNYTCRNLVGGLLQINKAAYEGAKAGLDAIKYINEKR